MRNKYLLQIILMFFIMSVSTCKCNSTENNSGDQVYLYSFEKSQPITQEKSKQMVTDYLGIKDVHDLTINRDENVAYFVSDSDVNTTFEQNLSNGNFEFSTLNNSFGDLVPQLPSKDEAVKIAENFMRTKNILPKNLAEMRLVHNGGIRSQAVVDGRRAGPIVDKLITLTYSRVLDSLQVIGAGSKIIVNIGDKGAVVGMNRRWRELNTGQKKQLKTEELITKTEAEEQAKRQIVSEFGNVPYEIKSSLKSYYDGNGNYMQPVWAFDVLLNLNQQDQNVQSASYLCIIPMMKNSPEPLKLNVIDPKAKEMIKSTSPARDSLRMNQGGAKDND